MDIQEGAARGSANSAGEENGGGIVDEHCISASRDGSEMTDIAVKPKAPKSPRESRGIVGNPM